MFPGLVQSNTQLVAANAALTAKATDLVNTVKNQQAQIAYVSKWWMIRVFRFEIGVTPGDYDKEWTQSLPSWPL